MEEFGEWYELFLALPFFITKEQAFILYENAYLRGKHEGSK